MELTPRCARVLQLAQVAGRKLGHRRLNGVHLLLGLGDMGTRVVQDFFWHEGITREMLVDFLLKLPSAPASALPEDAAVSAALVRAGREAVTARAAQLGTAHLFVGILAGEGDEAARLLEALGVDRTAWLQEMRRELTRA